MGHNLNRLSNRCVVVGNHLQLLKRVGTGGYGAVYLAADLKSGQQYAIKIVLHQNATQPSLRPQTKESVANEIERQLLHSATRSGPPPSSKSSSRSPSPSNGYNDDRVYNIAVQTLPLHQISRYSGLSPILKEVSLHLKVHLHPNVLTIHHVYESRSNVFIVMDYYPEGDLFAAIVDQQRYVNDTVLIKSVFKQLCDALIYCHSQSVYHCDMKPENILIANRGAHVVIADFGLAIGTAFVDSSISCGSSYYMAPERVSRRVSAANSTSNSASLDGYPQSPQRYPTALGDIWSLGIILVNLSCTRNPWLQAHLGHDETFKAFMANPLEVLRNILPVSVEFAQLLIRLFQLDPFKRITLRDLRSQVLALRSMHELGPMSMCLPYYDNDWETESPPAWVPTTITEPGPMYSSELAPSKALAEAAHYTHTKLPEAVCRTRVPYHPIAVYTTEPAYGHAPGDEDDSLWAVERNQSEPQHPTTPECHPPLPSYEPQADPSEVYDTQGYDYYNSFNSLQDAGTYLLEGFTDPQNLRFQTLAAIASHTTDLPYALSGFLS